MVSTKGEGVGGGGQATIITQINHYRNYDLITQTVENLDLRGTRQIICHSKLAFIRSNLKYYFLLNLKHSVRLTGT